MQTVPLLSYAISSFLLLNTSTYSMLEIFDDSVQYKFPLYYYYCYYLSRFTQVSGVKTK